MNLGWLQAHCLLHYSSSHSQNHFKETPTHCWLSCTYCHVQQSPGKQENVPSFRKKVSMRPRGSNRKNCAAMGMGHLRLSLFPSSEKQGEMSGSASPCSSQSSLRHSRRSSCVGDRVQAFQSLICKGTQGEEGGLTPGLPPLSKCPNCPPWGRKDWWADVRPQTRTLGTRLITARYASGWEDERGNP